MVLVDLLRASTKDQLFQFNGQLDKQTDGVAIDIYHTTAILSPRRKKSFVFARLASHWMRGWTRAKSFVSALRDKGRMSSWDPLKKLCFLRAKCLISQEIRSRHINYTAWHNISSYFSSSSQQLLLISETMETENNGLFTFLGMQLLNRAPEISRPGLLLHYQSHIHEDFWKPSLTVHIAYRIGRNFLKNVTVW